MTNDKLSDIEVKLINATRKFVKDINENIKEAEKKYYILVTDNFPNSYKSIETMRPYADNLDLLERVFELDYAESGDIPLFTYLNDKENLDNLNKYKEILSQEVPEIKDRMGYRRPQDGNKI
jgi:hypothetical protein